MTHDGAIGIAHTAADKQNWTWREPVNALRVRSWFIFGKARWQVWSNAGMRGSNVIVEIDDATGQVLRKNFAPR